MNELLNKPMPADKALEIIRSLYDSNRMIRIVITATTRSMYRAEEVTEKYIISSADWLDKMGFRGDIVINLITPIIPTYSVGDKVLILSTGEIGIVTKIRWDAYDKPIEVDNNTDEFYHWSQICKLPN